MPVFKAQLRTVVQGSRDVLRLVFQSLGLGLLVVYFGLKISVSKALFTNRCRVLIVESLNGDHLYFDQ